MDISKWNAIMKSFQDLMGYQPGINEVLVTKRLSKIGFKDIETISGREEKYLVHILRKRYREILDEQKRKDVARVYGKKSGNN
tara:strand:+ start:266 stop:514 length:249 start_codon:yes stop_codon:yes gene_type:complete